MVPFPAHALTVAVELLVGVSTFHLTAGTAFDRDGGFGEEIRPQINLESKSLSAAFDVFYQGRIGSNFGSFPLSRVGGGINYYPFGLSMQKTVLDNGVTVNENRFAPYVLGQLAFTTVAVTDPALVQSFNALTVGYQLGGGGEIPIATNWSAVVQFMLEGTLLGGSSAGTSTSLSYSAYTGLVGISIHP